MKIKFEENEDKKLGEVKTEYFFAWFPVWIKSEIRWLEHVYVKYECVKKIDFLGFEKLIWVKTKFVD